MPGTRTAPPLSLLPWRAALPALCALLAGCAGADPDPAKPGAAMDLDGDGWGGDQDCDDNDAAISPSAAEVCDGLDNDCDGLADASATGPLGSLYYADGDGDGYGSAAAPLRACALPAGYATAPTDCDDADPAVHPGATEVCDPAAASVDEDCDGLADDGDPDATGQSPFYADSDGDGYGAGAARAACDAPPGFTAASGDCDDARAAVNPGAAEVCGGLDGALDDDCDGLTDDDDPGVTGLATWYADNDGDGYGTPLATLDACALPAGYSALDSDCDDTQGAAHPGGSEICDGLDNDCDRLTDDGDPDVLGRYLRYTDLDGDGYGDPATAASRCVDAGAAAAGDCDDARATVNPGAAELCNSRDDDCDGLTDDADPDAPAAAWYVDDDGDGYGDPDTSVIACDAPLGYVDNALDPLEDAAFSALVDAPDLQEVVDLVATPTTIYVVGFDSSDLPVVVGVDRTLGAAVTLYAGSPLVQPSGLALSADGATLYLSDLAADGASASSGVVFSLPASGGVPADLGLSAITAPGDVAVAPDGSLWISGLRSDGAPALWSWGGGLTEHAVSGLEDPMALAASADAIYLLDMRDAGAVLLSLPASGASRAAAALATGLRLPYPGGLTLSADAAWVYVATHRPAALRAFSLDGSRAESVDLRGLVRYPVGLSDDGGRIYVGEADPAGIDVGYVGY